MKRRVQGARGPRLAMLAFSILFSSTATSAAQPAAGPEHVHQELSLPEGRSLTLGEALSLALDGHPELQAARAVLDEARGRLVGARTFPYNPELGATVGSRRGGGDSSLDYGVELAQPLEIAGQRSKRIDVGRAEVNAERANLDRATRVLAATVHLAFVDAAAARQQVAIAEANLELAQNLLELSRRRMDRGGATQLEVNLAAAEAGRAEARLQAAMSEYLAARARLAEAVGLPPSSLPVPTGEMDPLREAPPLPALVKQARAARADLLALGHLEKRARANRELQEAIVWPNVTLRAFAEREEGTDTIIGGGIAIPLPLWQRNQGGVAESQAMIARTSAERARAELAVEAELTQAYTTYVTAAQTAERLRTHVLGTFEDNLQLLQRSFDAGKTSWQELLVLQRIFVDVRQELVEAEAEARRAWVRLQLAAGKTPVPAVEERQ